MIISELNPHKYDTTDEQEENLATLCKRLSLLEAQWGSPFQVDSGLRSPRDQALINPKAPHSRHLIGAAADIADPDNAIKDWLRENPEILENAQLWCEHWEHTPTWCHFQIFPPKSGNRWFIP